MPWFFFSFNSHDITKQVGAAICIDVLKYEADSMEAIVRVRER